MKALAVDARNDVMVSATAGIGFWVARYGAPQIDAWLAIPLGLLIAWSGFELAIENVRLLMGEAPPLERQHELVQMVRGVSGVRGVGRFRIHYVGTELFSHVEVFVDPDLTVGQAHDIGEAVRTEIESLSDMGRCSVHIDPAPRQ
jgi:cation diffusion facilitator family transporter